MAVSISWGVLVVGLLGIRALRFGVSLRTLQRVSKCGL